MTNPIDRWAYDHATDESALTRLLRQRRPKFETAQQFGVFVSIIIDEWEGSPPVKSWMGVAMDIVTQGALIQTSPNAKRMCDAPAYHMGWIRDVLLTAAKRLYNAQLAEPDEYARGCVQAWAQKDVFCRTYRAIAKDMRIAHSSVSNRVHRGRAAIFEALTSDGRTRQRELERMDESDLQALAMGA